MRPWKGNCSSNGFSLIQLVVALAVVGILAGAAYPSYMEASRKAKRAEGRSALYQLMLQEERFYSRRHQYIAFSSGATGEDEKVLKWFSGNSPESSAYEIKGEPCAGETILSCVRLVAMPGTGKVDHNFKDPECGELSLTSKGEKGANRPDCWR